MAERLYRKRSLTPVSKFVTFCSANSLDYFPKNSNNSFSNKLASPFLSHGYSNLEMGLIDGFFVLDKESEKHTIFGHAPADDIITYIKDHVYDAFITKIPEKVVYFIEDCNKKFKELGTPVVFRVQTAPSGPPHIEMKQSSDGQVMTMTKSYAEAFGFTQTEFQPGTYLAPSTFSQALFDKINLTDRLKLTFSKKEIRTVKVAEPTLKTVIGLMNEINKACESLNITFTYDGETLEFTNEGEFLGVKVKLSKLLNEIFGLEEDFYFHKKDLAVEVYGVIDLKISASYILVTCDSVEHQIFNGKMLEYLRFFKCPERTGQVSQIAPNPVKYVPVKDSDIYNVQISFLDENLVKVPMTKDSESFVTVHFRTRRD